MKKVTKKTVTKPRAVLVTTLHRGVFFGHTDAPVGAETVVLTECRNVIQWDAACKGFLGLAANGPVGSSRLGPAALRTELRNVTSVTDIGDAVSKTFTEFPVWS